MTRVLLTTATAVALLAAAGSVDGCGATDCNDTATCDDPGADVVVPRDNSVANNDDGAAWTDVTGDAIDDTVPTADGAVGSNDGTFASSGDADASDALDEGGDGSTDVNDAAAEAQAPPDTGVNDAEAGMDAPPEAASIRTCKSNPLVLKAAVASSVTINLATEAIDKNFTTRWESAQGVDPQWIYVDLGAPAFIDRVQILWLRACAANYDLQVSNSTGNWVTIRSIVGNTTGNSGTPADWTTAVDHTALSSFGRYLRVFGKTRCDTAFGYSMWEIQVSGDPNASCTP